MKLNPKNNIYPKINEQHLYSFLIIQNLFKNNLQLISTNNYNNIFSNKDNEFLSGKKWMECLINSKDIIDYYIKLSQYSYGCNLKKLLEVISNDIILMYYYSESTLLVEELVINFAIDTRRKLEKIRFFLNEKDWSNYFFNLQRLMHEQIIKFLNWENKSLNYKKYINNLIKELNYYCDDDIIKNYIEIIQEINLYRNLLAKATSIIPNNTVKWTSLNDLSKEAISWKLYFSLIELINFFNLLLQEKNN